MTKMFKGGNGIFWFVIKIFICWGDGEKLTKFHFPEISVRNIVYFLHVNLKLIQKILDLKKN